MSESTAAEGAVARRTSSARSSTRRALQAIDPHDALITTPLRTLMRRAPVTVPPTASIREAAALMREQGVSSLMLLDSGHLVGIVTDRDLRNRVLAAGLGSDRPVSEIATIAALTVPLRATAFEALLMMARHDVHHVPVMDGTKVAGMITATDLAAQQSTSAVMLAGEIHAQQDVEGLARASARIRQLQRNLAAADATAYATGHVITAITDTLTIRLLQLAESRLGPAPIEYVWVAAGSQARAEQTAKSDQDNCLILDDRFDPAQHGPYFEALSRWVCSGLDACGYVFCPGDMMAMTDAWRQPLRQWKAYFRGWIEQPDPAALMHTGVFFDLRAVHGSARLFDEVYTEALQLTRSNSVFLANMVRNALGRRPPLDLFGRISTPRAGKHRGKIDLKMHGIVPIIDLARIYALAGGHLLVNTFDRLDVAAQGHEVSEQGSRDLRDAMEYLAQMRIRHQVRQIDAGEPVDNLLAPAELSNFERTHLKDAFHLVATMQDVLGKRYQMGQF
ncbi:MAG: DUF294 nucleotidyltransferase-like domain-containing protein [Aquincola sp.]|nr:DUF294 nucleotidyltransferase-like domain-containing protein [Aquincola sp.]